MRDHQISTRDLLPQRLGEIEPADAHRVPRPDCRRETLLECVSAGSVLDAEVGVTLGAERGDYHGGEGGGDEVVEGGGCADGYECDFGGLRHGGGGGGGGGERKGGREVEG